MSIVSFVGKNYIKFFWRVKCCALNKVLHSDQFKIGDVENVVFNIGLIFNDNPQHSVHLWVKKSNSEIAHAIINLSFEEVKSTVEIHDWKDYCRFKNIELTEETIIRKFSSHQISTDDIHEFKIICEIFWKSNIKNPPHSNLFNEMKNFYNSQDFSDVTVVVGEVKIPSHKLILSAHSPVFSRMLQTEMRESKENIINLKDFDAEIILEMLQYFYTGETKASHDSERAMKFLKVADIYQITKLKDLCEYTLFSYMSVDNALDILDAADDYNAVDLRYNAMNFIVCNSKKIFATSKFKKLFYEPKKPDLLFELICVFGDKK